MQMVSDYFSEDELKCKCGCGRCPMHKDFLLAIDLLRQDLKCPVYVSSGFRCERHNKSVGGVKGSWHTFGKAFDIFTNDHSPTEIAEVAKKYFLEVIPYEDDGFCHCGEPVSTKEIILDYLTTIEEMLKNLRGYV